MCEKFKNEIIAEQQNAIDIINGVKYPALYIAIPSGRNGNIKHNYNEGFYMFYSSERIKRAFALGNGSEQDFINYVKANKQYLTVIRLSDGEII